MAPLTVETIRSAEQHSAGQPYPVYIDNLHEAGIRSYHVSVDTHDRRFFAGTHEQHLDMPGTASPLTLVENFDLDKLKAALRRTQSGQSDYPTLMKEIAEAGVHFYVADVANRKVSYFGKAPNPPYEEQVPLVNK